MNESVPISPVHQAWRDWISDHRPTVMIGFHPNGTGRTDPTDLRSTCSILDHEIHRAMKRVDPSYDRSDVFAVFAIEGRHRHTRHVHSVWTIPTEQIGIVQRLFEGIKAPPFLTKRHSGVTFNIQIIRDPVVASAYCIDEAVLNNCAPEALFFGHDLRG